MSLTPKQQTIQAIKKAKNILITFKDIERGSGYPAGGDAIASALALRQILTKNNKNVENCSSKS